MKQIEYKGSIHQFPDEVTDDQIRQALTKFDAGAPDAAQPAEAPKMSLSQMVLPATKEYQDAHGAGLSFGEAGALAKDVLSFPKRMIDANIRMALNQSPDQVQEAATRTKPQGVVDAIAREAPLMATPQLKLAGSGAMRIMSAIGSGAAEAVPSVAVHQLEGKSEGQDFSLKRAAEELAAGGGLRGAFNAVGQTVQAAIPHLKRGVSKLSEVAQDALESVTNPTTGAENMAQTVAAAKRFGTAEGGTDVLPLAEEIGKKLNTENAARVAAVEQARGAQRLNMEQDLLGLRSDRPVKSVQQISAGAQGNQITDAIEAAKAPMQDAWQAGDQASLGSLRDADAAKLVRRGAKGRMESVRSLVPKIADVLSENKALSPDQGVPKITRGAAGAIKTLLGMADEQGNTIDDLLNLKGQLRSMQAGGKFAGEMFDATTDDRAFGKVAAAIDQTIEESIGKAVPDKDQANQIVSAFRANQAKYAQLKDALGDLSQKLGQVQNNANIISKIKEMGPQKAVDLIQTAEKNAPLKPVVEEMRKGFVDDLLLSSVKNGEFSPEQFAKEWANLDGDVKTAWLSPQQIQSVEKAVAVGTKEIHDAHRVGGALFGGMHGMGEHADIYGGERKLANITSAAQKGALAELRTLDALFGTQYTQEATAAYRAKQLQLGESGTLPAMGNIRTGKAAAAASSGAAIGGSMGAAVAGPAGAALGSLAGTGAGFFLQSPAGAVLMFRALNRLGDIGIPDAGQAVISQGLRSATFQPQAQRITP